MAYVFKYLIGAACAHYADGAIAQYPPHDALVHIHSFHFAEIHLQCAAAYEADFDNDTMIGNGKLIRPSGQYRSDEKCQKWTQMQKYDPVVGGFKSDLFAIDQIVIDIIAHVFWIDIL